VVCKDEEGFIEAIREKDVVEILQKGNVLFGEDFVIETIGKVMR
jgi:hypothetical protein